MKLRGVLCLIACLIATTGFAAEKRGIGVYIDQDMLLPFVNEDRDYTMGIALEFFEEDGAFYLLDGVVRRFGELLEVHAKDAPIRRSYLIGSVNYTPDDLSATAPLPGDRPYSSVLFLANKRVFADDKVAVGVEAQVGALGTYAAREIQKALHQAWRETTGDDEPLDPMGWHNQISAGGEPTARLRVARSERLMHESGLYDLAGTWDLSLGYQTNASLGLSARAGVLRSPFWSIPYDPINRGNFVPVFGRDELYAWAAYRARVVGYDALIQGQFRDSALTYDGDDLNRLVHEAGFGVTGSYAGVQLTVAANMKTAELDVGSADRTHWWGGTYITFRF